MPPTVERLRGIRGTPGPGIIPALQSPVAGPYARGVKTVQVVIPAYNPDSGHLREAVASCRREPQIVSVIVVDDGSGKPVEVGAGDERVRVLRQENAGVSAARNRGLEDIVADYILFLDHDDFLEPGGVGVAVDMADRMGAAAVVSARYEVRGYARTLKDVPAEWKDQALPAAGEVFRPLALFGASGLLVFSRVIRMGIRFDPDLMIGEDREFLRRVASVGPVAVSSRPLHNVRLHQGGSNLSSASHLNRRVRDHLVIVERHHDKSSDQPLRQQTVWLLNQISKRSGIDPGLVRALRAAARARGWPVPLKSRVRSALRRLAHA
jgi:GT2 family glycosyltransferase